MSRVNLQYPHEFSGGMRQRAVMAIALAGNPKILFADEPTTALDVTIQAQILDVFRKIQKKLGMATVFISHDLGVVAGVADRVAVMYAGKIAAQRKSGTAKRFFMIQGIRIHGGCCSLFRFCPGGKNGFRHYRECLQP